MKFKTYVIADSLIYTYCGSSIYGLTLYIPLAKLTKFQVKKNK